MEHERKKLPIGIEMFRKIRTAGFYYVDKTSFIKDLLTSWAEVNLITRPRRFGKTLNMDMLKTFFEPGTDPALFQGLKISEYSALCNAYMGKYPVISISLKDVEGCNFEEARDMLGAVINEEAMNFQMLMDSPRLTEYEKKQFERLLLEDFEKTSFLTGSLKLLLSLLSKHYGKQVILLIDEYDVPLDKAYQNNYYSQMVSLVRSLFSQALKTNRHLQFAVITGCLRIAKESIFTGFNNFKVRTISDTDYAEHFGFTDNEVRSLLAYYEIEDSYDTIKEWYNGYHFGGTNIYCPRDVLNQCDKLRVAKDAPMEAYWENSSSNAIVKDIIVNSTATTRNQIETLISGESIEKKLIPELTYTDLDNEDQETRQTYLWSILFATGYLTDVRKPENRLHQLTIPNREILGIYTDKIRSWFQSKITSNTARWNHFCNAVKTGNAADFQTLFNEIMSESISIRDTFVKKELKENFYHGMLLGLLQTVSDWIVKSNLESGIGFTDILIEIPAEKTGCIIEIKYAENGAYDDVCSQAMRQIEDHNYTSLLMQHDMKVIHTYGIACYKKSCRIAYRRNA
ncbi:AAA family ATPase [Lachnospiraceae bacterium 48-42]